MSPTDTDTWDPDAHRALVDALALAGEWSLDDTDTDTDDTQPEEAP